jgi:hypothetical protein
MSHNASTPNDPPGAFGQAFRDPEAFILRWHREGQPYSGAVFAGLAFVAVAGTLAYGALLGLATQTSSTDFTVNTDRLLECSWMFALACAISWAVPLPAVYILNSLTGMRLRASTTFLAALVTAAWGGFAFFAFLPIALIYLLSFPQVKLLGLFAHLIVFALVGISMACIFGRQIERVEPNRGGARVWWLWMFVGLQVVLLARFDLIQFHL